MQRKICMRRIKDCYRFYFESGLSQMQISKLLKIGRGTVQNYLKRLSDSELSYEATKDMTDTELDDKLFKCKVDLSLKTHPELNYKYLYTELKRPGVTRYLLWEEHKEQHPEDGYSYSQFCWHYRQWHKQLKTFMRQEHKGGEKVFVDYSGKKPSLVDLNTGEIKPVELFVMCWGSSHYIYAESHESQELENWIMGHVRGFEYFGKVSKLVVPDNLRSAVKKANWYDPEINRTYQELSEHYGFGVLPSRPGKPKDKASVENGVLLVQRWILAKLRNRTFHSISSLNIAIGELLKDVNNRPMQKVKQSRFELFMKYDYPNALSLPKEKFEYCTWYYPTIYPDYHIEVEKHYYSVPWKLYGKKSRSTGY